MKNRFLKSDYAVPLLMLVVCFLAYGFFLTRQGYYWDDWTVVYLLRSRGLDGLRDLFAYDRPFSLWEYVLTNALAGTDVLRRQILGLAVRWMVGVSFWTFLRALWPERRSETAWMGLLFCVYPLFFQQPVALTYTHPFIAYVLFCLSMAGMVWGAKHPGRSRWIPILGFLAFAVQLITVEYFVGLELVRPLVLWFALDEELDRRDKARKVFLRWLPYLVVYIGFIIWRLFFLQLPGDTNAPVVLEEITRNPIGGIVTLLENSLRDWIFSLTITWNRTLQVGDISLTDRFLLLTWSLVFLSAVFLAVVMRPIGDNAERTGDASKVEEKWMPQALWIGGLASAAGMLPFWAGGKFLGGGYYADRVGIPVIFGASIFLVAILFVLVASEKKRRILLAVLVGLAIGSQVRTAKEYAWDWTNQQRFFWQLHWRAPQIAPETVLISDDSLFRYVTGYSLSAAVNTLYLQPTAGKYEKSALPYWFIEANDAAETRPGEVKPFLQGREIERNMRSLNFKGDSRNSLIVYNNPPGRCLWVLQPEDRDYILLPDSLRDILPGANLDRIISADEARTLPAEIFGNEPPHDWCYVYQKAGLARQEKQWAEVVRLWEAAEEEGLKPDDAFERIPFIEAYLHTGNSAGAAEMSIDAYKRQIELQAPICRLWRENRPEESGSDEDWEVVGERLNCPK